MKKIAIGFISAAVFLGAGTAVFANGNSNSGVGQSFEKMLPFMQKMHPNYSKEKLQGMYKSCHKDEATMNGTNAKQMNTEKL
ncbi:hypothetical protein [Bacillus salipaludis]|uniref:hypothetical protein n=1 Tax=Bacillus salipaludis TaxID=2547811 RepID=UPI002E24E118|nr:hypothetical protein [Bacillus salipaludis]